jgi:iron complex outermembrane receptor protein
MVAGEQLVYVPRQQGFALAHVQWHRWELRYQHHYTGSVRGLNVAELPAFDLGALYLGKSWNGSVHQLDGFLRIENLWNVEYRVIERRPMPGRSYQLGLRLNLSRPAQPPVITNP